MNHVDELLQEGIFRMKSKTTCDGRSIQGFIDYDSENKEWVLCGHIWDGNGLEGLETFYSEHEAAEEAEAAFERIANRY